MPGEQLIGRVAVKVLPDTSDFRRRTKAQLDAIEKGLEVKVQARLETIGLRLDLLREIRKINQENRVQDSKKIKLYTTVETNATSIKEGLTKAMAKAQVEADKRRFNIKADIVGAVIAAELDKTSLRQVEDDIKDWRDRISPVTIGIKPNFVQGSGALISTRLAVLTRPRTVPIIPTIDRPGYAQVATALAALSGARFLSTIFEDLVRSLLRLDQNLPIIGSLALAVAGLAGWGLAAASNLFALSEALAQIGPAALVLPGIFGGLAIGLATSVVAFRDFNTYVPQAAAQLTALGDVITKNFWAGAAEPINNFVNVLLPQVVEGVANTATLLGRYWGNLATSLTGVFDGALAGMFADLNLSIAYASTGTDALAGIIAKLGGVGAGYLPQLAQWFVDISNSFDAFLTRAAGDGSLVRWIDTALVQIQALGSSMASIGGILAAISQTASNAGGTSLRAFADTLNSIQATIEGPTFQQGLTGAFAAAHEAMSLLASGSGPQVKQLFVELAQALQTILPIVGDALGTALGAISTGLTQVEVPAGLVMMFDGLRKGIEALAPAMAPLGTAFGALLSLIGTLATAFGPLLAAAIVPLSAALTALAPVVGQVVTLLAGALTQAIGLIGPPFAEAAQSIASFVSGGGGLSAFGSIVGGLLPLITTLGSTLAGIIGPIFTALGPVVLALATALGVVMQAVTPLAGALLSLIGSVLVPLVQIVSGVLVAALPKLSEAFASLASALLPVVTAVQAVVNFLMPVLVPALTFLVNLIVNAVIGAISGLATAISGVVTFFTGLWNIVAGLFTGNWGQLWEGVKQVFVGAWNFIKGAFEVFLNVGILRVAGVAFSGLKALFTTGWAGLKTLWSTAIAGLKALWQNLPTFMLSAIRAPFAAIKALFSALGTGVRTIIQTAWTALQTIIRNVMFAIGTIISTYINLFRTAISSGMGFIRAVWSSAWTTIKAAVTVAWSAIKTAVSTGISNAVTLVKEFPGKAKAALGDLSEKLKSAGSDLVAGLIRGITGKLGDALRTAREMADKIKNAVKGALDINSPSKVMIPIGGAIPEGLALGIRQDANLVDREFDKIARDLATKEIDVGMSNVNVPKLSGTLGDLALDSEGTVIKQLIYNAAPGSSLGSEEDLFAASDRARFGW